MRGFVNAFVPTCTTTISRTRNIRDSNSLLWLARETADEDRKKKKKGSQWEDSSKDSVFGSFFKGKDSDDSEDSKIQEEDESSKVPIVGRFFKTEEEKAEKEERRAEKEERKKRKKQEKERIKLEQREMKRQQKEQQQSEGSGSGTNKKRKRSKIIPAVKNYLEERQIRKDAEILRSQVQQREQDRQKQMEKDAEELRLEVQNREQERLRQREEQAKKDKPAAAQGSRSSSSSDDSVQRQVATQKELDQKRKERAEKAESIRSKSRSKKDKESNSSKSQRLGSVVSAAQKFVSGVFDNNDQKKNEEWIVVAPKTRISPGEIVAVTAGGIDLLLVASKDGSAVHCVANSCPHLGTPLEVGSLERLPIESSSTSSSANATDVKPVSTPSFFQEKDISRMLTEDGCEDCIVCPLHKTAFALESGEVRGEWCPYPPVIGKLTGAIKQQSNLPVFDVRTKGKNIEIRLNTPVEIGENEQQ
eukprot:CAMPEP_0172361094 /NCGR_PEP_ID=MMETSP1060-20121228/4993_1 /TAXON_ID=37318 /ORGANISM="Pseudo-nitzschia pungens, Strain cf. cingulata" /LENGTH=474 /DNA_ID=CAMNT_0013083263 /DNA_START=360 /DNA_END=1784 /DNA_ORIENTATION=-